MRYAGFWKRFAAFLLDYLILLIPSIILQNVVQAATGFNKALIKFQSITQNVGGEVDSDVMEEAFKEYMAALIPTFLILFPLGLLMGWAYYALQESSRYQATLGKRALGIVVTDLSDRRISLARATGRYFGKFLSGLTIGIGYIMAGFTDRKQALHDLVAGTLVVKK
jgi:uncharacterized RDD family membrane protein YckC